MANYLRLGIVIILLHGSNCQSYTPDVRFDVYTPRGFEVSIPDKPGVKLFAFHGQRKLPLKNVEPGEFNIEIKHPKNGRWTYFNPDTQLEVGDVIYYWIVVHYNNFGYRKDDQIYNVTTVKPLPPEKCEKTLTFVNGDTRKLCVGDLIFEDDFTDFLNQTWNIDHFIPVNSKDYEFVSYQNDNDVVFTNLSTLCIKLKPKTSEEDIRGLLDLREGCTGSDSECTFTQQFHRILPPVVAGRIHSKFRFRYGRVEVKAKLPSGDWIYPQIKLKTRDSDEEIWIAYVRGNEKLTGVEGDLGSRVLYGGLIKDSTERSLLRVLNNSIPLTQGTHVYEMLWTPNEIAVSLDGIQYGSVNASGLNDKEFHITVGVGVGGISDFPDGYKSGNNNKPWTNKDVKQMRKFFDARENWLPTWMNGKAQLEVDYVKVFAL